MKLFKHQKTLLCLNPDKHLLAWSTGSGKTLAAIELVRQKGVSALIVCPKSIVEQWREQVPDGWDVLSKENFKKEIASEHKAIVLDEVHYFSNYKSQMTKALLQYIKIVDPQYIYGLSATPYLSTSWNIYTYGLILGRKWRWIDWNNKFFYKVKMGPRMVPIQKKMVDGTSIEKCVANLINQMGSTVKLEDCFDVPEQIFIKETFDLTREQKKAMDNMEDFLPIVRFTKEHQICGGSLKGDEYTENQFFKSEKLDRLMDLVDEHKKLVIVCRYNNELDLIYDKIRSKHVKVAKINGKTSNRHDVIKEANQWEEGVICIQAACSEGYELPSFPLMIFYSYDFSLKNYVQMLGRIQRAGHIKKNVYLSLLVNNSIDHDIYDSVVNKKMDFMVELYK